MRLKLGLLLMIFSLFFYIKTTAQPGQPIGTPSTSIKVLGPMYIDGPLYLPRNNNNLFTGLLQPGAIQYQNNSGIGNLMLWDGVTWSVVGGSGLTPAFTLDDVIINGNILSRYRAIRANGGLDITSQAPGQNLTFTMDSLDKSITLQVKKNIVWNTPDPVSMLYLQPDSISLQYYDDVSTYTHNVLTLKKTGLFYNNLPLITSNTLQNFANTNLTTTTNRVHSFGTNTLQIGGNASNDTKIEFDGTNNRALLQSRPHLSNQIGNIELNPNSVKLFARNNTVNSFAELTSTGLVVDKLIKLNSNNYPITINGLNADVNGNISLPSSTLPTATSSILGGVKVGAGLAINGSGVLSATGFTLHGVIQNDPNLYLGVSLVSLEQDTDFGFKHIFNSRFLLKSYTSTFGEYTGLHYGSADIDKFKISSIAPIGNYGTGGVMADNEAGLSPIDRLKITHFDNSNTNISIADYTSIGGTLNLRNIANVTIGEQTRLKVDFEYGNIQDWQAPFINTTTNEWEQNHNPIYHSVGSVNMARMFFEGWNGEPSANPIIYTGSQLNPNILLTGSSTNFGFLSRITTQDLTAPINTKTSANLYQPIFQNGDISEYGKLIVHGDNYSILTINSQWASDDIYTANYGANGGGYQRAVEYYKNKYAYDNLGNGGTLPTGLTDITTYGLQTFDFANQWSNANTFNTNYSSYINTPLTNTDIGIKLMCIDPMIQIPVTFHITTALDDEALIIGNTGEISTPTSLVEQLRLSTTEVMMFFRDFTNVTEPIFRATYDGVHLGRVDDGNGNGNWAKLTTSVPNGETIIEGKNSIKIKSEFGALQLQTYTQNNGSIVNIYTHNDGNATTNYRLPNASGTSLIIDPTNTTPPTNTTTPQGWQTVYFEGIGWKKIPYYN